MATGATILVVDDDPHLREVVAFALKSSGYSVIEAENGKIALELAASHSPSLIVLDLMMPEMDGFDVCRTLRQSSRVPIIFLSSRDEDVDRILGLELGADDFVGKPFSPRELVARVKAVLRRLSTPVPVVPEPRSLKRGPLRLEPEQFRVFWNADEVTLTVTEFQLLEILLKAPTKAFSREELMERVYDDVIVSDRTIDSHIRRIRQKFSARGGDVIETVHGLGYRLLVS